MVDVFTPAFVNREPQVEAFEQILEGSLKRYVFLIDGEPEIGKSFLLDQFLHMAGEYRLSRLDFRDEEPHTFLSLIHAAMRDLGVEYFGRTRAEIGSITRGIRHDVQVYGEEIHKPQRVDWGRWRRMLGDYFSEDDLKNICFDLHVDYENFPGDGKAALIRELLAYMRRVGRHMDLLEKLKEERPNVPWDELISQTPAEEAPPRPVNGRTNVFRGSHFLPPLADAFQQNAIQQQISLTFVDELKQLASEKPVILCYDSIEEAPDEAKKWLSGLLLDELSRGHIPQVIVLVSGRKILEVTRLLEPITVQTSLSNFDLETVRKYWVDRQSLSGDEVSAIFEETGGHPKKLADKAVSAGGKQFPTQIIRV